MFKTILLTVDVNEPASWKKAGPEAAALAKSMGATLHVLTVVPDFGLPVVEGYFPPDFRDKALQAGEARLEELMADDTVAWPEDTVRHLRYGEIHHEILAGIKDIGADLVVMASHAPEALREFLVGSEADRVVRRSPVSVLVVRG